jgi:hypothetical protein
VLADAAADRAGEEARLQRRDAHVAVVLGTPRLLAFRDQQPEKAVADLVASRRASAGAPMGEVVRKPTTGVERLPLERVLELELAPNRR